MPFQTSLPSSLPRLQVILVAGVDFVNYARDYKALCITRMQELMDFYTGKANLLFTIFDFRRGQILQAEGSGFSGALTAPKIIHQGRAIKKSDYGARGLSPGGPNFIIKFLPGILSITDVYQAIINIGKTTPGELLELSFFFEEKDTGFALVNTLILKKGKLEVASTPDDSRVAGDVDPDLFKDFEEPRMSEEDADFHNKAFRSVKGDEGYVRFWAGRIRDPKYDFEPDFFLAVKAHPDFKTGLPDDTLLGFPGLDRAIVERIQRRIKFSGFKIDPVNVKIPFIVIKYIFGVDVVNSIGSSYPGAKKTFGLPFSVKIEFETDQPYNLTRPDREYVPYLEFLSGFFSIKLEPGRKFMELGGSLDAPDIFALREFFQKQAEAAASAPTSNPATAPSTFPATAPSSLPVAPAFKERLKFEGKQVVLVAGFDFKFSGINFLQLCTNRMKQLVKAASGDLLQFHIIDFTSGKISHFDSRSSLPLLVESVHKQITRKNYLKMEDDFGNAEFVFTGEEGDVMRIIDVYQLLFDIGSRLPGSLAELSFFSHADELGPRTLNFAGFFPADLENKKSVPFDPDDVLSAMLQTKKEITFFDPDLTIDFTTSLMGEEAFARQVRAAWHPQGHVRVWGYETRNALYNLMRSVVQSKQYKSSGLTFEDVLVLKNPDRNVRLLLRRIFGAEPPLRVKVKFGHIVYVLAVILKSTYMYHLAKNMEPEKKSGREVYAGLPGTFAEVETGTNALMQINTVAYGRYLALFRNYFGFKNDPEKRGYAKYETGLEWDKKDFPGIEYKTNAF